MDARVKPGHDGKGEGVADGPSKPSPPIPQARDHVAALVAVAAAVLAGRDLGVDEVAGVELQGDALEAPGRPACAAVMGSGTSPE
jgi:hypothetical protein